MAALTAAIPPALAPSPYNVPTSLDYQLEALRTPTVIFVSVACFTLVISILLVCRHLHRTWRGITPEEHSSSDSDAAQQDKELSRMESQLHRLTPVVVLQPDSKVMCAHKDHTFMEAAKVKAQHLDGQNGPIPPLDSMAALTGDPTELPVITDLPALPADSPASPHPTSVNRFPLAMGEHFEGQHSGIPSRLGSLYQNPREAGSSSSLQSYAEHGDDGDGGFHFRQPSIREERQAERGFSDRHRNSSAVSLSSLAGSDVSTGSTTYVTELPEGSSLFYKGPHGLADCL